MFGLVFVIVALFFIALPLQVRSLIKTVCEKNVEWLKVHGEEIQFGQLHRALKRGLILGVVFLCVILVLNYTGELHSTLFVPIVLFSMLAQSALNKIGRDLYNRVPAPEHTYYNEPKSLKEAFTPGLRVLLVSLATLTAVLTGTYLYFAYYLGAMPLNITTLILQLVAPGIFYMFIHAGKYKIPSAIQFVTKIVVPCSMFMSFLLFAEFSSQVGVVIPKEVISFVCYGFAVLMIILSNMINVTRQVGRQ